jgi:1-acyl-sn-glycerol-3-phosphate acyltransferase
MTVDETSEADVEQFADALLAAVEEDAVAIHDEASVPDAIVTALSALRGLGVDFVRRYHRLEIAATTRSLDQQVLFVANHGFGGIFDLNVFAIFAALDDLQLSRPVTVLTHQLAWTLKVGWLIEPLGARPAGRESAAEAFAAGHHVLVLPGGDVDGFKSFGDRNRILFDGRRGFARLAQEAGVPIVPIVTAGAGESLLVLSDGARLARALRLDTTLRMKRLPVSVSLPWGLNVGGVGLLPYLPLPTKLHTEVLDPMIQHDDESAGEFGNRVETAMQDSLTAMTAGRRFLFG